MESNWITFYSLDLSQAWTMQYEGYYNVVDVKHKLGLTNYIAVGGNYVDIIVDSNIVAYYEQYVYRDKFWVTQIFADNEQEFWKLWQQFQFKTQIDSILA